MRHVDALTISRNPVLVQDSQDSLVEQIQKIQLENLEIQKIRQFIKKGKKFLR